MCSCLHALGNLASALAEALPLYDIEGRRHVASHSMWHAPCIVTENFQFTAVSLLHDLRWFGYPSALHKLPMAGGVVNTLLHVQIGYPISVESSTAVRLLAAQSCMGHVLTAASLGLYHHQPT